MNIDLRDGRGRVLHTTTLTAKLDPVLRIIGLAQ